jgi:hypothetical protein
MYKISVKLSEEKTFYYTVPNYTRQGNHIQFIDQKTGLEKSFPDHLCLIEEVEG